MAGEEGDSLTPQGTAIATSDGRQEGDIAAEVNELRLRPENVRVLVLEDDDKVWRERIRSTLGSRGVSCDAVKKLSDFAAALQRNEYDVASIDWALEGAGDEGVDEYGADALSLLREHYPAVARLVYSVHMDDPRVEREARYLGADLVVSKNVYGHDEEYAQAVLRAARLGLFRRVWSHLRTSERPLEEFDGSLAEEPSPAQERKLYAEALDALRASFLEGEEDSVLMNLLKRRGALREFNSSRYIHLPFHKKLAELLGYVRVTPEQLSQILRVDLETARMILAGQEEPPLGEQTKQHAHWLASVLDFVLRLSDDEPDLMLGFWTVKNQHRSSGSIPPWDSEGLLGYLTETGPAGLKEAVRWIRSY